VSRADPEPELEPGSKAAWTAAAVLLVATLGGAVVLAEWPLWGVTLDETEEPNTVQPGGNGTQIWPYTARGTSYDARTLGINVIVAGDPEVTRRAMVQSELEWEDPDRPAGRNGTQNASELEDDPLADTISWGRARGAVRYTQVVVNGERRWVDEDYQLHAGNYLGQRMHVRAYQDPKGEWTAMQAHDEHWDWFRLRHTVTGVSDAQREVEQDFMGAPYVEEVARLPYENPTADSDGWVTVVRLLVVLLPGLGVTAASRLRRAGREARQLVRRHRREFLLGVALFSLYLGVRVVGIALEVTLPVGPKFIAAPLYLALVVGLPGVAYWLGSGTNRVWAFAHAVGGLGTAFIVDFVLMGVSVVPLQFILHRTAVVTAVGLIAVGSTFASEEDNRAPLSIGIAGWVAALVLPAFGYI